MKMMVFICVEYRVYTPTEVYIYLSPCASHVKQFPPSLSLTFCNIQNIGLLIQSNCNRVPTWSLRAIDSSRESPTKSDPFIWITVTAPLLYI